MEVNVKIASGQASGRSVTVRAGQLVRVGRSESVELSVPDDPSMSEVHFSLTCDSRNCHLRATEEGGEILVNGEKVFRAVVHTGDRITAGGTTFSVLAEGGAQPAAQSSAAPTVAPPAPLPAAPAAAAAPPTPAPALHASADAGRRSTAEICADLNMDGKAAELSRSAPEPAAYLDLLVKQELFNDATRFTAHWLPRVDAVRWAKDCLMSLSVRELPAPQSAALATVERWIEDPSEGNRRAAEKAAEAAGHEGAASWIAMAVFWSGGSIAPEGQGDVPASRGLTAQAISAALTMAAVEDDPQLSPDRFRAILEAGRMVLGQKGLI